MTFRLKKISYYGLVLSHYKRLLTSTSLQSIMRERRHASDVKQLNSQNGFKSAIKIFTGIKPWLFSTTDNLRRLLSGVKSGRPHTFLTLKKYEATQMLQNLHPTRFARAGKQVLVDDGNSHKHPWV